VNWHLNAELLGVFYKDGNAIAYFEIDDDFKEIEVRS